MEEVLAGVDIGGTKISIIVGTAQPKILKKTIIPTDQKKKPEKAIEAIVKILAKEAESIGITLYDLKKLGISCPGPIDFNTGRATKIPNLKSWEGFPLRETFENYLGKPVVIENDANCAALGENVFGAGKNYKNFLYVTVSTGIGGGLIIDNKVYRGATGDAGEIGHMTLVPNGPRCGCGKLGCLEALASGTAIVRQANELIVKYPKSKLKKEILGVGNKVEAVIKAIELGDDVAVRLWDEAMNYLSIGISNILQVLNLEAVIIGGGVSKTGKLMFDRLNANLEKYTWPRPLSACKVIPADLGDDVVDYGVLALCLI